MSSSNASDNVVLLKKLIYEHLGNWVATIKLFFENLFSSEGTRPVFVFLSRKGFCLYDIFSKCYDFTIDEQSIVISDRYLYKITNIDEYLGRDFYVVDDTVSEGKQLEKVCNYLIGLGIESVKIHPRAVFVSEAYRKEISLPGDGNIECADILTKEELRKYTKHTIQLIEAVGIPFTMDLPVFSANMNAGELAALRSFEIDHWKNEAMRISADNDDGDEISFAIRYFRPGAGQNFLFEGMRATYCKCDNKPNYFKVLLIPVVIFDKISCDAAKKYLYRLFDTVAVKSGNNLNELKKMLDDKQEDELFTSRLHKMLSYVLALRVYHDFIEAYDGISLEFDEKYEEYHYPKMVAAEFAALRNLSSVELNLPEAAELDIEPILREPIVVSEELYEYAEDLLEPVLFQVRSNCVEANRRVGNVYKPAIRLHDLVISLRERLSADFPQYSDYASHIIGMASLCSTLRSCSSYIARVFDGYLYKCACSGENSYSAVRKYPLFYFGLYNYILAIGDITMIQKNQKDFKSFMVELYQKLKSYYKNDAFIKKLTELVLEADDVQDVLCLWPYISEDSYEHFLSGDDVIKDEICELAFNYGASLLSK